MDTLERILDLFKLTGDQCRAARERGRNLAVTAGAGSGKTRTLVARYLGLLSDGFQPRQVVAITFTEKAAREMRSRTRQALHRLALAASVAAGDSAAQNAWASLESRMDSARIGTIHSLCAEILRSHPAEAVLDPQFGVVEENVAAALRTAAVADALAWAVQQAELEPLFRVFSLTFLQRLLLLLLGKRLEVSPQSFDPAGLDQVVSQALGEFLQDGEVTGLITELRQAQSGGSLAGEAGESMAAQVIELLGALEAAENALARMDPVAAALALFQARRRHMALNKGKRGRIKDAVQALRGHYDRMLNPWLGGEGAKDQPPDPGSEALLPGLAPLLAKLYAQAVGGYKAALDARGSLDFDDLEGGTVALLRQPAVRARWQQELAAVLVDEFQDTNERQREIILALCGPEPGRLFVVGDARQSIYRFRGADVTVFTGLQAEIRRQGGLTIDLDRTFRAHPGLLAATGALLGPVMGVEADPRHPFQVPYAPLHSERSAGRAGVQGPFIEGILAAGEDSETARPAAARALAERLLQLRSEGQIQAWDEVALLFRASTTFPVYEQALEAAGIPFVTVAGSGFYDRPEIRDLLNLLRGLADPWDDLALAGLLRSPAFGVSDAGLYWLRRLPEAEHPDSGMLYQALKGDLSRLSAEDQACVRRALEILGELALWVDRLPVAELLQRLVERCDYRAVLAASQAAGGHPGSSTGRLWRNVDKLLGDAQASGQVRLRAFLEYITTLRDIGAREGEAASEAGGAVRLMTIHKSKGLEFPFVVLADAARQANPGQEQVCRLGAVWTLPLDRLEARPLAYRLARWRDDLQAKAEDKRLLYVVMTRAQEKLILSGHLRVRNGAATAGGWLAELLEAGGMLPGALLDSAGTWQRQAFPAGGEWALWLAPLEAASQPVGALPAPAWPESGAAPLYGPVPVTPDYAVRPAEPERRRPALALHAAPARVVGDLVHKALQYWRFPGSSSFERLLRAQAQEEGLFTAELIDQAVGEAEVLLRRFQRHHLYAEMDSALERRHELPFVDPAGPGRAKAGFMDCLYRTSAGWTLVDFKTDNLYSRAALEGKVAEYRAQLEGYRRAAELLLGAAPRALMVFLNVRGEIWEQEIDH